MKREFDNYSTRARRPVGIGLVMLLLLAVLLPSICLLWFMNQAVKSERVMARQKLMEAYRGQLTLAQERLESRLDQISREMETALTNGGPAMAFEKAVRSDSADAIICFDSAGMIAYPLITSPPKTRIMPAQWQAAEELEGSDAVAAAKAFASLASESTNRIIVEQALAAQARCLVKAGQPRAALAVITKFLADKSLEEAKDPQNRLIAADLELMGIELFEGKSSVEARKEEDRDRSQALSQEELAARLKTRLLDYSGDAMPSSQRRFLMRELQTRFAGELEFPTLAAEDLAARFAESCTPRPDESGVMRQSGVGGIWQLGAAHGRVLLLHKAEKIEARLSSWLPSNTIPEDVRVVLLAPGTSSTNFVASLPAGQALPGWRTAFSLKDNKFFDSATDQRIATYVWIGVLVLGAVLILATMVLGLVRKQAALTELRNDLVANVTHELKTPLSSMRLLVDTLLGTAKLDEKTTREYLALIAGENLRLSRLIDNFLTFSRIERNKYAFKFKELPAGQIAEVAAVAVRDRFNVQGCSFELNTAPGLPPVLADEDAMVTVLVNLLDNAFKYTGDEKKIILSATAENGCVRFSVKDNGIGLSPRETKRIFKRFYQVDQKLTRTGGGCGLGLSIVKSIVRAHHGKIEVDSQPGKGSTFEVSIPAVSSGGANR